MKSFIFLLLCFLMLYSKQQNEIPFNQTTLYKVIEITLGSSYSLFNALRMTDSKHCIQDLYQIQLSIADIIKLIHQNITDPIPYLNDFSGILLFFMNHNCGDILNIFQNIVKEFKIIIDNPFKYIMSTLANIFSEGLHIIPDIEFLRFEYANNKYYEFGRDISKIIYTIFIY